jgi:outer membrane lipoprotein SlyB
MKQTTIMKERLRQFGSRAVLLGLVLTLAGCASSPSSANTVRRSETGRAHTVQHGEVIYVREVTIEGEAGGAGAVAGGAMGFVLGGLVGGGRGRSVARVGGAVGGAAAGNAIERSATTLTGLEITVELEDGEVIVVIQAADEVFRVGDSVRVLRRSDGGVRVMQ